MDDDDTRIRSRAQRARSVRLDRVALVAAQVDRLCEHGFIPHSVDSLSSSDGSLPSGGQSLAGTPRWWQRTPERLACQKRGVLSTQEKISGPNMLLKLANGLRMKWLR